MSTNNKQTHKITDEQFKETYIENGGGCTKTAKAIEKKYGVTYTRQSVSERARNFPDLKEQALSFREEYSDNALLNFADDETVNIGQRIRIHINIANRLSKYRLLNLKLAAAKPAQEEEPEGIFEIDGKEFRF